MDDLNPAQYIVALQTFLNSINRINRKTQRLEWAVDLGMANIQSKIERGVESVWRVCKQSAVFNMGKKVGKIWYWWNKWWEGKGEDKGGGGGIGGQ